MSYLSFLQERAKQCNHSISTIEFAKYMDSIDELKDFRNQFFYPKNKGLPNIDLSLVKAEEDCIYLCSNSLGLQPKGVKAYIDRELDKWAKMGVIGHTVGDMPWAECDYSVDEQMAVIVGAKRSEIAMMNGLTVNQHIALLSFYKPTKDRNKILLEHKAFPSDHYAVASQIKLHNLNPEECMIMLKPREGDYHLRKEDILKVIEEQGQSIAIVMLPGVQFYTGQVLPMNEITDCAHKQGCMVGFDLAHAVGNVEIKLHDWNVDFAVWCTYKYLSSSAGGLAGFFIHENLHKTVKPALNGWWGHEDKSRFVMDNELVLADGARGFRLSNPPPLLCCSLLASLDIFMAASMSAIRKKSIILTGYLEYLLISTFGDDIVILTPSNPEERGAQLSLRFKRSLNNVFEAIEKRGVVCDFRHDIIRIAPAPLVNSFYDIHRFVSMLKEILG